MTEDKRKVYVAQLHNLNYTWSFDQYDLLNENILQNSVREEFFSESLIGKLTSKDADGCPRYQLVRIFGKFGASIF